MDKRERLELLKDAQQIVVKLGDACAERLTVNEEKDVEKLRLLAKVQLGLFQLIILETSDMSLE